MAQEEAIWEQCDPTIIIKIDHIGNRKKRELTERVQIFLSGSDRQVIIEHDPIEITKVTRIKKEKDLVQIMSEDCTLRYHLHCQSYEFNRSIIADLFSSDKKVVVTPQWVDELRYIYKNDAGAEISMYSYFYAGINSGKLAYFGKKTEIMDGGAERFYCFYFHGNEFDYAMSNYGRVEGAHLTEAKNKLMNTPKFFESIKELKVARTKAAKSIDACLDPIFKEHKKS